MRKLLFFNPHKNFIISFTALYFLCFLFLNVPLARAAKNDVYLIELNEDTINPITAEYISQSIDTATSEQGQCLIIKLDTPGGLLTSTRTIVKSIMSAPIPVIVYIAPSGSRAGSAGVFITYASHIAAMAPSTNIGAAHPVQMGGGSRKKQDFWDGLKELLEEVEKESPQKEAEEQEKNEKADESNEESKSQVTDKKDEDQTAKNQDDNKDIDDDEIKADDDPMSSKIIQDTVAFIRAMAQSRNRNAEWAIKSVTKSSSITATEAHELGVVEIIAKSESDLLTQLDGKEVQIGEKNVVLKTQKATIIRIAMNEKQKFFNILANPNIAFILMLLGFFGLMYEVTHPGIGVPGILGAIFMILAFFSMQLLPTNYAAVALIVLGLVLFVAEAFVPGFGLLTLGGIVCTVLGGLLLFDSPFPTMRISLSILLGFTLTIGSITVFLVSAVIRVHKRKAKGGQEGIVGERGEVYKNITLDKNGKVYVHGEIWNATAVDALKKGDKIKVLSIDSMLLKVTKLKNNLK